MTRVFFILLGICMIGTAQILKWNAEEGFQGWGLNKTEVDGKAIRIDAGAASTVWAVTPAFRLQKDARYDVRVRLRGKGDLWIHAWGYDADGKYVGDIVEPKNGRRIHIDSETEGQWVGIRKARFAPEAITAKLCVECQASCLVWLDAVEITSSQESLPEELEGLTWTLKQDTVHVGEWVEATYEAPKGHGYDIECGFISKYGNRHSLWLEENKPEDNIFRVRPMQLGEHTLRMTVNDGLGELIHLNKKVTVLPNRPPVVKVSVTQFDRRMRLDASATLDPDGDNIADFRWELPDGSVRNKAVCDVELPEGCLSMDIHLTVTDIWGLAAQHDVTLQLPTTPPSVKATLDSELSLTVGEQLEWKWSQPVGLKLGRLEYLPFTITNNRDHEVDFCLAMAPVPYAEVHPVKGIVKSGDAMRGVLPVQTWLNINHSLFLTLDADGRSTQVPLSIAVEEVYPLFGTQEHFSRNPPGQEQAEKDIVILPELPCQLYRLPDVITWFAQKRKPEGTFIDFRNGDWNIDRLLHVGKTQVHPFLGYVPADLKPLDRDFEPVKAQYWRDYVRALAERYKGRVRYWEPFNEPPWGGFENYRKNGAEVLGKMTQILAEEVRRVDPLAKIVAPGYCNLGADFAVMEEIILQGGDAYVDVYNFHEYTAHQDDILSLQYDIKRENGASVTLLKRLRKLGIQKPLFITECGGNCAPNSEKARRTKAIQFLRTCLIWLSAGIQGIQQYELYDYPHESLPSQFAMVQCYDHFKLPLFQSFHETILSLTGAVSCGPVQTLHGSSLRYACFTRGCETICAIWNCEDRLASVKLNFHGADVMDLQEKAFNLEGDVFQTSIRRQWGGADNLLLVLSPYQVRLLIFTAKSDSPLEVIPMTAD